MRDILHWMTGREGVEVGGSRGCVCGICVRWWIYFRSKTGEVGGGDRWSHFAPESCSAHVHQSTVNIWVVFTLLGSAGLVETRDWGFPSSSFTHTHIRQKLDVTRRTMLLAAPPRILLASSCNCVTFWLLVMS